MENSPISIRLATVSDLANIRACANDAYARYVERIGRKPAPMIADFAAQIKQARVYVAQRDNNLTGFVVFYRQQDHLHLENVAVTPEEAGNGFGRMLISFVEQTARSRGIAAVELYTNEAMTENLTLYPALGYVEIERKEQDGFQRVFFRKNISIKDTPDPERK